MAKRVKSKNQIVHAPDILLRYTTMGTWKTKVRSKKKGSGTPGRTKRSDTCQLTPIGGVNRKAFCRARSYKMKEYAEYCEFFDKINGITRPKV